MNLPLTKHNLTIVASLDNLGPSVLSNDLIPNRFCLMNIYLKLVSDKCIICGDLFLTNK